MKIKCPYCNKDFIIELNSLRIRAKAKIKKLNKKEAYSNGTSNRDTETKNN